MAPEERTGGAVHDIRPVGEAVIVQGQVTAVAADGTRRLLMPGAPVFADDRIVTGSDGMVSIVFADSDHTQLDLGRLSDVLVDRDVYGDALPVDLGDAAGDVAAIQQALQDGSYDPTVDSEAPAAGADGAGEGGGSHPYVVFQATGAEVTPDSGAETTGVGLDFLNPPLVDILPQEQPVPAPGPDVGSGPAATPEGGGTTADEGGTNIVPQALPDSGEVVEARPGGGSGQVTEAGHTVSGNLMTNDTAGDDPTTVIAIEVDGIRFPVPADGSVTVTTGLGGELTVADDGSYTYTIDTNILHETNGQGDGRPDFEVFNYTITDGNGDTASSTLTVTILDTAPEVNPDTNLTVEGTDGAITGNVIFGWDDSTYVPGSEDTESADPGLVLTDVRGDLAGDFALDTPLATVHGGTIVFHADGSYSYTPPASVDNPLDAAGDNQPVQERFTYTVVDGDGSPASAELTIDLLDTAPTALDDTASVEEGDRDGDSVNNQVSGNVILADHNGTWDAGAEVHDRADQESADSGLHLVDVRGDFAPGVSFAPGVELATAQGGTIVFASDGSYTYTAPDHILHEANGQGDNLPDNEQFTYTIEDGDGSRASAVLTVDIGDVDPSLAPDNALIDESDGTGPDATVTGSLGADFGADGAGSLSLAATGATWDAATATLHADDGSYSVALHDDGTYTFTLLASLDHPDRTDPDDRIDLPFTATIADADGDRVSREFVVTVRDDAPSIGDPQDAILANETGNDLEADLRAGFGADGEAASLAVELTGIHEGDPVLDSLNRPLTVNGQPLHYVSDNAGGWYAATDTDHVFHVGVAGDATYTVTLMEQVDAVWDAQGKTAGQTLTYEVQVTDGDGDTVTATFDVTFDSDHQIEGTDSDEVISGSDASEWIIGNDGDDVIDGGGGDDVIFGDGVVFTGPFSPPELTGSGDDIIHGGDGDDIIIAGDGDDVIEGGAGADTIFGNDGSDTVTYGDDTTGVHVDLSDTGPETGGHAEGDVLDGIENLAGGSGNDILVGDDRDNVLHGGAGDDHLEGGAGADVLVGGDGDDTLVGGEDSDALFAGTADGADGAGTDTLVGDALGDPSDSAGDLFADAGGDTIVDATDPGDATVDDLVPPPDPTA